MKSNTMVRLGLALLTAATLAAWQAERSTA